MKRLIIIDFMYMAHRHLYSVRQQEEKKGGPIMTNPKTGEESARLYYIIRDVEQILQAHSEDDVVICTDRRSARKDGDSASNNEYKANRDPDRFRELDINAIRNAENLLAQAGVIVLGCAGYEADDIIQSIARTVSNKYDEILIYTPDSDMGVLINDKVSLMRYKSVYSTYGNHGKHANFLQAHALVNRSNFINYWSSEFSKKGDIIIDYNTIMLYKATVGDTADNIKGITKFGNVAYMKLREKLLNTGKASMFELMNDAEFVRHTLVSWTGILLTEVQVEQALQSLALVEHIKINVDEQWLRKASSLEQRKQVYYETWGISKI